MHLREDLAEARLRRFALVPEVFAVNFGGVAKLVRCLGEHGVTLSR